MARGKKSPAAGEFLFEIDSEPLQECVTALGGIPLLVRAARSLDVPGSGAGHLRLQQRERGWDEATYRESFLVLNAVGGDCLQDFDQLGEDAGLAEMLGHAYRARKRRENSSISFTRKKRSRKRSRPWRRNK